MSKAEKKDELPKQNETYVDNAGNQYQLHQVHFENIDGYVIARASPGGPILKKASEYQGSGAPMEVAAPKKHTEE